MKKSLLITLPCFLLLTSPAFAQNWSFKNPPRMQTALTKSGLVSAWKVDCNTGVALQARQIKNNVWGEEYRLLRSCQKNPATVGEPILVGDGNNNQATVWASTPVGRKGAIWIASGQSGKRLTRVHKIVSFKKRYPINPTFGVLYKNGRIWLAWQEPTMKRSASFSIQSFSAASGRANSRKIKIVGAGSKWADTNSTGSFILAPTSKGLVALWRLTDAGGATQWYGGAGEFALNEATLLTELKMRALGIVSVNANMHFAGGADGNLYRVEEKDPGAASCIADKILATFELTRFDGRRFIQTPGASPAIPCFTGVSLFAGFSVDKESNWNLVSKIINVNNDCKVQDDLGSYNCQRFTSPVAAVGHLWQRGSNGSFLVDKELLPPTDWAATSGKTVAWLAPDQGLTRFMSNKLLWLGGKQKVNENGSVVENGYEAVLSDIK